MNARRWYLFGGFVLLLLVAILIMYVTPNGAYMNRQRIVESYQGAYSLACEGAVGSGDDLRHILVFQSVFQGWPGENRQDIVVTDAAYKVLDVHATGNESMFVTAAFNTVDGHELLTVRRSIRPGLQAEIVSYEYVEGTIREVSRAIDPPEIALPPHMKLSR